MSIEWNKLRSWNGSQASAFDELICQLASYESMPSGSTFIKKGSPDAGVECYWILPTGQEHGWQAKFFTSPPTSAQWGQVDSSIKTALDKHPALKIYTICMAVDRADARLEGNKSFFDSWNNRVDKWKAWAADKGMQVEFCFWGSYEIIKRLSLDENRGRYFFWFHEEFFTPTWFRQRLTETIAAVGPRYTPELNVRLPISAVFEGLARSPIFFKRFQKLYGNIGKTWSKDSFRNLEGHASTVIKTFYQKLTQIITIAKSFDRPGIFPIDWEQLRQQVIDALRGSFEIERLIQDLVSKTGKNKPRANKKKAQEFKRKRQFDYALYNLRSIEKSLMEFSDFIESNIARLTNTPALLITGEAGTGKTHLFSDAAQNHIEVGSPAVLLLGNRFRNMDPWGQILHMLDLSCNRDEFLGALETAAQLSGQRAIIFIDALNEGDGRNAWGTYLPSILACLALHPWIAIAVSVRSSYETLVIQDDLVPEKLIRFEHFGFSGQEYDASKAFFSFYGIELPAVPMLTPEFRNPLFLSCFCQGLKNRGLTRIPPGINGISSVFSFFLDSINEKLAKPSFLDYDPRSRFVSQVTESLAAWFSRTGKYWIPRSEAKNICDNLLFSRSFETSLFYHLLSEGILSETITYDKNRGPLETITFSYERLADHLVMKALLKEHVDPRCPNIAFSRGQPLYKFFKDESACRQNQGLAEALAIQGPETLEKEIFELIPDMANKHSVCEAFIESLLWREPRTCSEKCLSYLNKLLALDDSLHPKLLNTILTIAPNPEHPFNADFLHHYLIRKELADRDAWWSVFLANEYGANGPIDRLVDWAWSETNKTHIYDESIRLAGKTLVWFLTTSHRFIRDRATKALVSLFTDRIHVLCKVIPDFVTVNDPYVLERLYAVAYGCSLRSNNTEAKASLAQMVYDLVFRNGTPPCHILLRDYARGVIEVALRDKIDLKNVDKKKIRPPYKSKWPLEIPTEEQIKGYGEWKDGMPDENWALHSIFNSVLSFGDFARYILGSDQHNLHWFNYRLGEPRKPTKKEQADAFKDSLTNRQKKAWDSYLRVRAYLEAYPRISAAKTKTGLGQKFPKGKTVKAAKRAENMFRKTLGKKKTSIFNNSVLPYLNASPKDKDELALPVSIAQRWIFKRVLSLGWTIEMFGKFDRSIIRNEDPMRSADKVERIGKKYQWLAYHEFLAHIADNLEFREDIWSDEKSIYSGPWQLWLRDIDPSCLLKKTYREKWELNASAWWSPTRFDRWKEEPDEVQWRKRIDLLPSIPSLPIVIDPVTGREWLVLNCFYRWEESSPPDKEKRDVSFRYIQYFLKSYLIKAEDEDLFYDWAKDRPFMTQHMPGSREQTRVFLGEYFWAPSFKNFDNHFYSRDGWTKGDRPGLPCEVLVTTDEYMQERSCYDCSIDDTIILYLPAKWIADKMNLSWHGVDGRYFDQAGNLFAQDPSTRMAGPRAFLVDKELISAFLNANGYRLVWTLVGEKDSLPGWQENKKWPGRMELHGHMKMKDEQVIGEATVFWITEGQKYKKLGNLNIP